LEKVRSITQVRCERQFPARILNYRCRAVFSAPHENCPVDGGQVMSERDVSDPWFFEVDEQGMIVVPDVKLPQIKADIYELIVVRWLDDIDSLIGEIDQYEELRMHFQRLFVMHAEERRRLLEAQINELEVQRGGALKGSDEATALTKRLSKVRRELKRLRSCDPEECWKPWIRDTGPAGLPDFTREIEEWLKSPIDWCASEMWPEGWSGQGQALKYFRSEDGSILEQLDVVLVEGEHPGSTYHAAELRGSIEAANSVASKLALPFRFRRAAEERA
jgi:hypothetical protein